MIDFFPSRSIALAFGPLSIHWYGVMYALAFLLGIWMLPRMLSAARLDLKAQERESIFLAAFLGVVLGGRLGFVLFYGADYFLEHPLKIFAVWEGGMSSHGGFIGVLLSLLLLARRKHIDFLRLCDAVVIPVAVGLALGRLGNLINGELYGTVTQLPWGMEFPGAEGFRHPTQIYAIAKDIFIAAVCWLHLSRTHADRPGKTAAIFCILYAILRFTVEIFREQPYGFYELSAIQLSPGQVLTIPILIIGFVVFFRNSRGRKT